MVALIFALAKHRVRLAVKTHINLIVAPGTRMNRRPDRESHAFLPGQSRCCQPHEIPASTDKVQLAGTGEGTFEGMLGQSISCQNFECAMQGRARCQLEENLTQHLPG